MFVCTREAEFSTTAVAMAVLLDLGLQGLPHFKHSDPEGKVRFPSIKLQTVHFSVPYDIIRCFSPS